MRTGQIRINVYLDTVAFFFEALSKSTSGIKWNYMNCLLFVETPLQAIKNCAYNQLRACLDLITNVILSASQDCSRNEKSGKAWPQKGI